MKFKIIAAAIMCGVVSWGAAAQNISGAGATFPAPIYQRWASDAQPQLGFQINYQSIGSGAGVNQISNRTVDFGATDAPLDAARLAASNLIQIPTVTGSIVLAYNLPGVDPGSLRLTPELLADIYLGKITHWNDARLVAVNPGVPLRRMSISPLYRADGSGTTWIYTKYLSEVSDTWRDQVGSGTSVRWPTGQGARGNEGVSSMVSRSPGSIGYVESSFAVINRLPVAQLQNRAGNFVQPTAANVIAAALNAEFTPANGFVPNLLNQAGDQTWPIVGATYLLIPTNAANPDRSRRVVEFVNWAFEHGDASAARLHYVPLPATVKHQLLQTLRDRLQIN